MANSAAAASTRTAPNPLAWVAKVAESNHTVPVVMPTTNGITARIR